MLSSQARSVTWPPSPNSTPESAPRTREADLHARFEQAEAADHLAVEQRADLEASPAAQRRRPAEEVALEERHIRARRPGCRRHAPSARSRSGRPGCRGARRRSARSSDQSPPAIGPACSRCSDVRVAAAGRRAAIAGGVVSHVDRERDQRPFVHAGFGIEAERDEVVAELGVLQRMRLDGEPLVFVDERDGGPCRRLAPAVRSRGASAGAATVPRPPRVNSV